MASLRSSRSPAWQRFTLTLLAQGVRLWRDPQTRRLGQWGVGTGGAIALCLWNWQLVLSTSAGVGAMLSVYWLQTGQWRKYWATVQRVLDGPQQPLVIAVASGGGMAIATYLASTLWLTTENHWLATSEILQSIGIIAILGLLISQFLHQHRHHLNHRYDRLVWALSHPNPIKRLFAVRKLSQAYPRYSRSQRAHLREYFLLSLSQEDHPRVQHALVATLNHIDPALLSHTDRQPLHLPLHLKHPIPEPHWVER
ncbi:hypothetical protein PN441_04095 [Spirulina major CS-329]|uniref:hypothetical protein n=1 Tax=Spirulina TaxID=1154 RepID=UPI00232FD38F|nr:MULTISPECIES: hypothetical protein [Spirulina]MDB9494029.1 hypothetical protein [Spirulina subsalsa CS-330]MDB9502241.1 hypothetical protein [Spirulina major CS-329]